MSTYNNETDERFNSLYREMFSVLLTFALAAFDDIHTAQDVVQETFFIAYRKNKSLLSSANPKGWLFMTLKNVVKQRRKALALDAKRYIESLIQEVAVSVTDPLDIDVLYGDLSENPSFQLVKDIAINKKSFSEIAEEQGTTNAAVRKRYQRAREELQGLLGNKDT
jgi:RNA polymerase sigma-70 factor (ECF subfamily)